MPRPEGKEAKAKKDLTPRQKGKIMYDPKSKCADDFINHEEIMETLAYAEKNKHNRQLIDEILEKARQRKGLSHRDAAVLLDCDLEDKNQEIYALPEHAQLGK